MNYVGLDGIPARQHAIQLLREVELAEEGPAHRVIESPKHPYTEALVRSIPRPGEGRTRKEDLPVVAGQVPDLRSPPSGCRFHPRCPYIMDVCTGEKPAFYPADGA